MVREKLLDYNPHSDQLELHVIIYHTKVKNDNFLTFKNIISCFNRFLYLHNTNIRMK